MKESHIIFIYFALLGVCIYYANVPVIITFIAIGIIALIILKFMENSKINNLKQVVEKYNKNNSMKIVPFVNVNKENWRVLQELPHVNRVLAKKIVYIRDHGDKYKSLDDFFVKNLIHNEDEIKALKKLITIK